MVFSQKGLSHRSYNILGKVHIFLREHFRTKLWLGICSGIIFFHQPAAATNQYIICSFLSSGVDAEEVETFRFLLAHELKFHEKQVEFRETCEGRRPNTWSPYALRGQEVKAQNSRSKKIFIEGSVRSIGKNILTILEVEYPDEKTSSYKLTIAGAEEYDVAAKRFALALIGQMDIDSPELGLITQTEVPTELRRKQFGGFVLQVGGMKPINSKSGPGSTASLGSWFEAKRFVIETAFGAGWSSDQASENSFKQVFLKLGALNVLGDGNIAGIAGGGIGLFLTHEKYKETVTKGGLIKSTHPAYRSGNTLAPGIHARVGALLFRTYNVRFFINLDYGYSFLKNKWEDSPQSIGFSGGAIW